ncbi:YopT-type cysteine protease domain-containing protein [Aliarcobacter vitoriensis]|uniref:Peptidase C58 YopT-type domain-containing protein n=1 Tax=Aliarcobacter vitoriensis TaxID=2011099 RepID=A0A366MQV1_9BACT|nr:YopT-type cysteine protease domain-containing protein [Aliarcobacter vitoriensis]RBQ27974.1 hypothetical protein CRU91_11605 [Aliarcobacter vitoriensis]
MSKQNIIKKQMLQQGIISDENEVQGLCLLLSCEFIFQSIQSRIIDNDIAENIFNETNYDILKKYYDVYNNYVIYHSKHSKETFNLINYVVNKLNPNYEALVYNIHVPISEIVGTINNISQIPDDFNLLIALNYENGSGHTIAVIKKGKKFYLFDPNRGLKEYLDKSSFLNQKWYEHKSIKMINCCYIVPIQSNDCCIIQ